MNNKKLLLILISICFLSNCQIDNPISTSTVELLPNETPTIASLPKALVTTTINIDNYPNGFERQCLNVSNALSDTKGPIGYIVLTKNINSGSYELFDIKNMVINSFLPNKENIWDIKISPNQKLLIYLDGSNSPWLNKIASVEGEIERFAVSESWSSLAWLDDENIIMGSTTNLPNSTFKIYNYLTGKEISLSLGIPDPIYWVHPTGKNILIVSINPDITRVVFFNKNDGDRIVFWDNETNQILSSLPYPIYDFVDQAVPPSVPFFEGWSSDGKNFITTSPLVISETNEEIIVEELFQFNYNGEITQLTQLSNFYNFVRITQPVWSPNGELIALWLEVSNNENQSLDTLSQQLVILNKRTNEIKDLCLQFGEPQYSSAASRPIWLPDSDYLIVETRMPGGKPIVNLVNIKENSLITIQDDFIPVGWIISP